MSETSYISLDGIPLLDALFKSGLLDVKSMFPITFLQFGAESNFAKNVRVTLPFLHFLIIQ